MLKGYFLKYLQDLKKQNTDNESPGKTNIAYIATPTKILLSILDIETPVLLSIDAKTRLITNENIAMIAKIVVFI